MSELELLDYCWFQTHPTLKNQHTLKPLSKTAPVEFADAFCWSEMSLDDSAADFYKKKYS